MPLRGTSSSPIESPPLVSVIIPTKNSRGSLEVCLKSVNSQTFPNLEVIVADSASHDGTPEIARLLGASVVEFGEDIERTAKKNYSARLGTGSYLYFVDSDFELTPGVIGECVKMCQNEADAVIVPERVWGNQGFWSRCRQLEVLSYEGDDNVESPRFFRREAFLSVGGFDSSLIFGEENDLAVKIRESGLRVKRAKAFVFHHEGSVVSVIVRKFYYGRTAHLYFRKRGWIAVKQFGPVRVGWIRNKQLIARHPIYTIGFLLLKLSQYEAGIAGLLVGTLGKLLRF